MLATKQHSKSHQKIRVVLTSLFVLVFSAISLTANAVPKMAFGTNILEQNRRTAPASTCWYWFSNQSVGSSFASSLVSDTQSAHIGYYGSYIIQELQIPTKTSGNNMPDLWIMPGPGQNLAVEDFEIYIAKTLDLNQPNLASDPNWVSLGVRHVNVFFDLDALSQIDSDEDYRYVKIVSRMTGCGSNSIYGADIDSYVTFNLDETMFADVMLSSSRGVISHAPLEKPDGNNYAIGNNGWFIAEFTDNFLKASGDDEADLTIMESAALMETFSVSINAVSSTYGDPNWIALGNSNATGKGLGRYNIEAAIAAAGLPADTEFPYILIADAHGGNDAPDIDAIIASAGSASNDDEVLCGLPSGPVDPALTSQICMDVMLGGSDLYAADINCLVSNPSVLQLDTAMYDGFFDPIDRIEVPQVIDSLGGYWQGAVSQRHPAEPVDDFARFAEVCYSVAWATTTVDFTCGAIGSDQFGNDKPIAVDCGSVEVVTPFFDPNGPDVNIVALLPLGTDHSGTEIELSLAGEGILDPGNPGITNSAGEYGIGPLGDGNWSISYYADNYVHGCTTFSVTAGVASSIPSIGLYAGDINNDKLINMGDVGLMTGTLYGLSAGDLGFDANGDLNQDGTIDVYDLAILGSHFGFNNCGS